MKELFLKRNCTLLQSALFLSVSFFFFIPFLFSGNYFTADSYEYINSSENFLHSGSFYCGDYESPYNPLLETKRTPGYPLFLSIFNPLKNPWAVSAVQILISLFSFLLICGMYSGGNSKYAGYVLIAFYILNPAQFLYPLFIMSETLFQFFLVVSFLFSYSFSKNGRFLHSILSMASLSFAILVKPVALALFPFLSLFFIYMVVRRAAGKRVLLSILLPCAAILSVCTLNLAESGSFSVSSIGSINLMRYNTYMFVESKRGEAAADSFLMKCNEGPSSTVNEVEGRYMHLSAEEIRSDVSGYTLFHLKGVLNFFFDVGRFDINQYIYGSNSESKGLLRKFSGGGYKSLIKALLKEETPLLIVYAIIFLFNAVFLMLYILSVARGGMDRSKAVGIIFIAAIALATGPVGASRFKMPVFPIMAFYVLASLEGIKKVFMKKGIAIS